MEAELANGAALRDDIIAAFDRAVRKFGDRIALSFSGRDWSYDDLARASRNLAARFIAEGVKQGDRLIALGQNSDAYFIAWLACARAGIVHVPINYALTPGEVAYVVQQCQASGVLYDPALADSLSEITWSGDRPLVVPFAADDARSVLAWADQDAARAVDLPPLPRTALAQLLYTSGTTGAPKGAMMTHGAFLTEYHACAVECDYGPDDIALAALPLYHSAQMHAFTMPQMLVGTRTLLLQTPVPDVVLRLIEEQRITSFFAPPTVWINLLRHPDCQTRDLSSLRKIYYGAAIMPEPVLEEIAQRLPDAGLYNCYGQSEIAPVATVLRPEDHAERPTSAGRPIISVETRVIDTDGNDTPPGVEGEIVHRSPQLMTGYWNMEEATREAFAGGWFHSGDLGHVDEAGYIYVVDRLKDVINTGGVLVASREVEDALLRHPAVSEAAAIAAPDAKWIEAIFAIVVLKAGEAATESDLLDVARQTLAPFKLPKKIVFAESLPRNTAGKVLKRELRDRYT